MRRKQARDITYQQLFENNRQWAAAISAEDADFFKKLAAQQAPEYLWIGCSDSRVPANELLGLLPGELFVHRNIANVVVHTDLNCLSVLQFAVAVLKVKHVIVCGHYGCSGVHAALVGRRVGLADNWLRHVQDVRDKHERLLNLGARDYSTEQVDLLCELNAIEQALNVAQTTVLRDAWERGQNVRIHAWVYGLKDGLVRDLKMSVSSTKDLDEAYSTALKTVTNRT